MHLPELRLLAGLIIVAVAQGACGDSSAGDSAGSPPMAGQGGGGGDIASGLGGAGGAGGQGELGGSGGLGGLGAGGVNGSGGFGGAAGSGGLGGGGAGGSAGLGGEGGAGGGEGGGGGAVEDPCGGFDISPDVLVDVGYSGAIPGFNLLTPTITIEGDRILGGGILWDSDTRTQLLPKYSGRQMVGDRVLGEGGLYDAATGALLAAFAASEPMGFSEDGDFAFYTDAAGLHVVDAMGLGVLDWTGGGAVKLLPGELLIAGGAAGSNVIEHVTFGGVQALTPFTGTFQAWFRDGQRFITSAPGNNVRIYSKDGVQEHLWPLPTIAGLAGMGNYFWTVSSPGASLTVYQVGVTGSGVTTAEGNLQVTQTGLGSRKTGGAFDIIVPGVSRTTYATGISGIQSMGADGTGNWVVDTMEGVVTRHGTPSDPSDEGLLGCGGVTGLAGTQSGYVAIATESAQVLVFHLEPSGKTLEHVLPAALVEDMEMSEDGLTLLAASGSSVVLWDLATETSQTVAIPQGSEPLRRFDYSDAGDMISSNAGVGTIADLDAYWPASTGLLPCIRPAGAGSFTTPIPTGAAECETNFFVGGTPVGSAPGCAMGWLSNDRVLVQQFTAVSSLWWAVTGADIYDASGNFIAASPLEFDVFGTSAYCELEPAGPSAVFLKGQRRVVDWTTGSVLWSAPPNTSGRVAGRVGTLVAWEDTPGVKLISY